MQHSGQIDMRNPVGGTILLHHLPNDNEDLILQTEVHGNVLKVAVYKAYEVVRVFECRLNVKADPLV